MSALTLILLNRTIRDRRSWCTVGIGLKEMPGEAVTNSASGRLQTVRCVRCAFVACLSREDISYYLFNTGTAVRIY